MKLQDITQPLPFTKVAQDAELVKEIQVCLNVRQTGVFGPTTDEALCQFAKQSHLDNYQSRLLGSSLAQTLLEAKGESPSAPAALKENAFERALKFVLQWEGGYVNNPADRGGETNKGITWQSYNAYREKKSLSRRSVSLITDPEVREIYKSRYWDLAGCDQMPAKLAIAVFDWHVNSGRGVTFLQECLGCKADGVFGKQTANDLRAHLNKHGEEQLLTVYLARREAAYRRWAAGDQKIFLSGWLNRLNALNRFLDSIYDLDRP